jgi:hypothetical protein
MILKPAWALTFGLIMWVVRLVLTPVRWLIPLVGAILGAPAAWAVVSIAVLWLIADHRYILLSSSLAIIAIGAVLWISAGRSRFFRNLIDAVGAARR